MTTNKTTTTITTNTTSNITVTTTSITTTIVITTISTNPLHTLQVLPQNSWPWATIKLKADVVLIQRDGEEVPLPGFRPAVDEDTRRLLGFENDLHLKEGEMLLAEGVMCDVGGVGAIERWGVDLNYCKRKRGKKEIYLIH